MTLNRRNAGAAIQRLNALPQTKHVFAVGGPYQSCVLVWVLHDGARHNLSTEEQVIHAVNPDIPTMDYGLNPSGPWPIR
jgi:hypothetical protein